MTLRKVDWLFILFAVAVVVGVSLLPTPKDRNPTVPRTAEHDAVKAEKDCVGCHGAGAERPLPARHPKRPDCFRCHARQAVKESMVSGSWSMVGVGSHWSEVTGKQREWSLVDRQQSLRRS